MRYVWMVFLDKIKNPKSMDGVFGQEEKSKKYPWCFWTRREIQKAWMVILVKRKIKKAWIVILEKRTNPKSVDGVFGQEGGSDLGTPWRPLSKSGITTNPLPPNNNNNNKGNGTNKEKHQFSEYDDITTR